MNANGKSILSVAKAYAAMLNPKKETVSEGFKRPKWMPESIMDEMGADFINAVKEAQEAGKDTFEFGGKKYKVTLGKAEEPKGEAPLPQGEDADEKKDVKESTQLTGEQQIATLAAAYRSMYEAADEGDKEEDDDVEEVEAGEDETKEEGYVSAAQRKAVWANRADGGKGHPDNKNEELKGDQHKLDVDGDGKIEGEDLAKLRAGKDKKDEVKEANVAGTLGAIDQHASRPHKVSVTVSGKDGQKMSKRVIVRAANKDHAVSRAKDFYAKKGFQVHSAEYSTKMPHAALKTEELKGDQHKLDVDGDGKIEGEDLAKLRAGVKKEALDPKADAGVWIKDFQQSDDPKFAGKDADKRKEMALAAWYQARRDAGIKEEDAAEIKHDNVTDKAADQDEMEKAPEEVTEAAVDHEAATAAAHKASAAAKDSKDPSLHSKAYDAHLAAGNAHADKAAHTSDTEDSAKHMNHANEHLKRATLHRFLSVRYGAKKSAVKESVLNEDDLTKKAKEGSDPASSEKFEPSAKGEKAFKDAHTAETSDYSDNTKENPTGSDKVKQAPLNKTGGKPSTETVGPDTEAKTGDEKVVQNPENKTSGVGSSPTVAAEKEPETGAEKVSQAEDPKAKGKPTA